MVTASASTPQSPWKPTRYLEPNHPDNEEVVEQAQYMAAVTRLGTDARSKRYKPRRTVDYMGPMMKWRQVGGQTPILVTNVWDEVCSHS